MATVRAYRCLTRMAALVLFLAFGACGSDNTTATGHDGRVSAIVTGPSAVSAVVIDFTAVSDVDVEGGDVFTSVTAGGGIRAIIVLHEPGEVRARLTPLSDGAVPTATLVDVSDAAYAPANPAAFDIDVRS